MISGSDGGKNEEKESIHERFHFEIDGVYFT